MRTDTDIENQNRRAGVDALVARRIAFVPMRATLAAFVALACTFGLAACGGDDATQNSGANETGSDAAGAKGGSGGNSGSSGGTADSGRETGSGGSSGGAGELQVGDPCTSDSQCPSVGGGVGTCMKDWPGGGACTDLGCTSSCPGADGTTWCTLNSAGNMTYCAPSCEEGIVDCTRPGYACMGGGCLPAGDGG